MTLDDAIPKMRALIAAEDRIKQLAAASKADAYLSVTVGGRTVEDPFGRTFPVSESQRENAREVLAGMLREAHSERNRLWNEINGNGVH